MQIIEKHIETKTQPQPKTTGRRDAASRRRPTWRPEPSGLSRDELRRIVLDTLG